MRTTDDLLNEFATQLATCTNPDPAAVQFQVSEFRRVFKFAKPTPITEEEYRFGLRKMQEEMPNFLRHLASVPMRELPEEYRPRVN